uniref:Endoplasmic reticulum lectin n=1 Tax=Blastobotrys adeninivorans TaxID=409370 RepID=A0A060T6U3_BLAAD
MIPAVAGALVWALGQVPTSAAVNIYEDAFSKPQFSIDVSGFINEEAAIPSNYHRIVLKGHDYLCDLPDNITDLTVNSVPSTTDIDVVEVASKARELLALSPSVKCIYHTVGYWTYELCYDTGIRQFHALPLEQAGGLPKPYPNTPVYHLGRFSHQSDWTVKTSGDSVYASQTLGGGTICDLTGKDRVTEVQYYCREGLKTDQIAWMTEFQTCHYAVAIYTSRLCSDLAFIPPKESNVNVISCTRVLKEGENLDLEEVKWLGLGPAMDSSVENSNDPVPAMPEETSTESSPESVPQENKEQDKEPLSEAEPELGSSGRTDEEGHKGNSDSEVEETPLPSVSFDYDSGVIHVFMNIASEDDKAIALEAMLNALADHIMDGVLVHNGIVYSARDDFIISMTVYDYNDNPVSDIVFQLKSGTLVAMYDDEAIDVAASSPSPIHDEL